MTTAPTHALLLLTLTAPTAAAHDMWIEPTDFSPDAPGATDVAVIVGHDGVRDPYARNAARLVRFDAVASGDGGVRPIPGEDGSHPAGRLEGLPVGTYTLAYRTTPAEVTLSYAAFRRYLRTEGDPRGLALLRQLGDRGDQHERYARSLSAVVRVGDSPDAPVAADLPLEIVLDGPIDARGRQPIRVLVDGAPSRGARVRAERLDGAGRTVTVRTDDLGRATVRLEADVPWRLATVHLRPRPDGGWASTWSTWVGVP